MIFLNNLKLNLFDFVKYNTLYTCDSNVFWMVTSQYMVITFQDIHACTQPVAELEKKARVGH
jgi:hypothetical protein